MTATGSWRTNSPSPGCNLVWRPEILNLCASQCGSFLARGGNFGEVGSIDVLGKREYSWLHPRECFSRESKFHLGNPGPDFRMMGATGVLALTVNFGCLLLLTRHRNDDLNMRSTWLCSRNDIIANAGVLAAAVGVLVTASPWPDLAIGLLITAVFLGSGVFVVRPAGNGVRP